MLVNSWRKLRKRLLDAGTFNALPFIAVFETTKQGEPHLHILLRAPFIDQKLISEHQKFEMGAPIVWIEKIESKKKAANYCAKYCGKNPKSFAGCKRYYRSKDYIAPKEKRDAAAPLDRRFQIVRAGLESIVRYARFQRLGVTRHRGWFWFNPPNDPFFRRYLETLQ